jgi:Ca2+-binding RTX toxin-like protein
VRDSFAVIVEQAGEGNDLVRTTVDYILSDELDRLSLIGGAGIEATGNGGRNNILSSVGGDTIDAASGDDWVTGRGGDDQISGGAGQDRLSGGDGADTFVFLAGDSTEAAPDRILDFEAGSDHIDLSGLDDHAGALHFSTARHLRGEAGQVIAVVGAHATFVHVDLDGDGASDLTMTLKGAPTLTAADFVF